MGWQSAAIRQQVSGWRDDVSLSMAEAVNAIAVDAPLAVEREMLETSLADPLTDGFGRVRPELDALIRARCEAEIAPLLNEAARRLRAIDPRAEGAALALLGNGWPTMPPVSVDRNEKPENGPSSATGYLAQATSLARRLVKFDHALVAEGLRVGAQATTALGDTVRGWTGYDARMRARAMSHTAVLLLVGTAERPAVLEQLDAAIDNAAATVRMELA